MPEAFTTYRVPVVANSTRHYAARTFYALELESEGQDGVRVGLGRPRILDSWPIDELLADTVPLEHAETSVPAPGEALGFFLVFGDVEETSPAGELLFYTVRVWHVPEAQYARSLGKRKAPTQLFLLDEGVEPAFAAGAVLWFPGPASTDFYDVLQELQLHEEHALPRGYQLFGYFVSPDSDLFDVWVRYQAPGASNSVGLGKLSASPSTSPAGAGFVNLNGGVVPVHQFLLRVVNQDAVPIELAWGFGIVDTG